jgi:hypothetical protein
MKKYGKQFLTVALVLTLLSTTVEGASLSGSYDPSSVPVSSTLSAETEKIESTELGLPNGEPQSEGQETFEEESTMESLPTETAEPGQNENSPKAEAEIQAESIPVEAAGEENAVGEEWALDWMQSENIWGAELTHQASLFSLSLFEDEYGEQLSDIESVVYRTLEQNGTYRYHSGNYLSIELRCEGARDYAYGISYDPDYVNNPEFQNCLNQAYADTIRGFDAYIKDHPRDFWANGLYLRPIIAKAKDGSSGDRIVISRMEVYVSLYYNGVVSEKNAVEEAIATVENRIQEYLGAENSRSQKVAAIHDYLAGNITYGDINDSKNHTITGALLDRYGHQGVCESYAKIFKIICDDFGIPCVLVAGRSTAEITEADHMWNCVKMEDGNWYLVDVTWDRGVGSADHSYLLIGNDQMGSKHIPYGIFTDFNSSTLTPYSPFVTPVVSQGSYVAPSHVHREIKTDLIAPSCNAAGVQKYQCICGYGKREQSIPTVSHNWGNWYTVTEASVSANGLQRRTCSRCGTSEDASIPALPATAENKTRDFVKRLYRLVLGREAEVTGRESWVRVLLSGKYTGAEVANGFIFSEEYRKKQTSNETFVEMLYQALLDRNSDTSGRATWVTLLEGGVTREGVFAGFVNSVEFSNICHSYGIVPGGWSSNDVLDRNLPVTCFVGRLYRYCLERKADEQGQRDWVSALLYGNTSGRECAWGFFHSVEFDHRAKNDEEFLRIAYRTLLNREPDGKGLMDWKQVLSQGGKRDEVLNGFLNSVEFNRVCSSYGVRW